MVKLLSLGSIIPQLRCRRIWRIPFFRQPHRKQTEVSKMMSTFKVVRNVLGTVGILYFGMILLEGMIDSKRYARISAM
jgi:hypothetical protein